MTNRPHQPLVADTDASQKAYHSALKALAAESGVSVGHGDSNEALLRAVLTANEIGVSSYDGREALLAKLVTGLLIPALRRPVTAPAT